MTAAFRRFFSRLANLARPDRGETDLARELASHLALLEDEYRRRGLPAGEARRAARRTLGGVDRAKELHRSERSFPWFDDARRDVSYAVRMLRRHPIVTATALLSLAIGIGANTAIFTVANALLFRGPAGVADADRLVDIGVARPDGGFNPASFPTYTDVRDRAKSLAGVYAHGMFPGAMSFGIVGSAGSMASGSSRASAPERVFAHFVTSNYFAVLGVQAAVGRVFDPAGDGDPGAQPVVVLSRRFWARRFNGDAGAVGQTIRLNGEPFTVIGIAPEGFQGTGVTAADAWMPLNARPGTNMQTGAMSANRDGGWLVMGARLQPGISVAAAAAEVEALGQALAREYPNPTTARGLRLLPSSMVPGNRALVAVFVTLLMGMVSFVLLVACANVSGILLARAAARRREIAVRLALGADRGRLIRQLLTETAVLFAIGGGAGFVLARGLISLLVGWMSALPFPVMLSLGVDSRVMAFTTGISFLTALAAGLAPALQTSTAHPIGALKDEAHGLSSRSRLRHAFVVAQVALSVTLVVGAGLFARALTRAGALDPGYDPRGIELTTIDLSMGRYSEAATLAFWRSLIDRVRELPGVQEATIARALPGGFETMELGLGLPGASADEEFQPDSNMVEPGYFATLRIPIIAGRDFNTGDRAGGQPVAIVGETAARRFWPGESAVGKYLSQRTASGTRAYLVVGVAGEIKSTSLIDGMSQSFVYVPVQQQGSTFTSSLTIITRARPGESVAGAVRKIVGSMNPDLPIAATPTLADSVALGLMPQRIAGSISGSLGIVGLLLAAIGIYGVTAFTVTRRLREFGIRVALGARRADIVRIVLRQGLGLTFAGCAIGVMLAGAVAQGLSSVLLGLPVLDPVTFAGAVTLFVLAGLGACYGPARRATGLDPVSVLRSD